MIKRLKILLQLLTKSWQKARRIAMLSQMILKICMPGVFLHLKLTVAMPIENTELVPQFKSQRLYDIEALVWDGTILGLLLISYY